MERRHGHQNMISVEKLGRTSPPPNDDAGEVCRSIGSVTAEPQTLVQDGLFALLFVPCRRQSEDRRRRNDRVAAATRYWLAIKDKRHHLHMSTIGAASSLGGNACTTGNHV